MLEKWSPSPSFYAGIFAKQIKNTREGTQPFGPNRKADMHTKL